MQANRIEVIARKRAFAQSRVALARATDERAEFCALAADASRTVRDAQALAVLSAARLGKVARRGMRGSAGANALGFVACIAFACTMGAGALHRADAALRAQAQAQAARFAAECEAGPIVRADNRAAVVAALRACRGE